MAIDFKLDDTNHDLVLELGDIQLVTEAEEIAQSLKIRFWFVESEWVFDYTLGLPWFDSLFTPSSSLEEKEQIFKDTITATQGVVSLTDFLFSYDPVNRGAQVDYEIETIYSSTIVGEVTSP